jgi:hypothetical protein
VSFSPGLAYRETILGMSEPRSPFASIERAVEELRAGRFVVVVDDEDRENEGDLVLAAERTTSWSGRAGAWSVWR